MNLSPACKCGLVFGISTAVHAAAGEIVKAPIWPSALYGLISSISTFAGVYPMTREPSLRKVTPISIAIVYPVCCILAKESVNLFNDNLSNIEAVRVSAVVYAVAAVVTAVWCIHRAIERSANPTDVISSSGAPLSSNENRDGHRQTTE